MEAITHIGVLTSGGDAPGMNAATRAIVRSAIDRGLRVSGIYDGYLGMFENRIEPLGQRSVSNIINRGGTILGSARFPLFKELTTRQQAVANLKARYIDALVVIGGDGTFMGAKALTEMGYPCIGIPGTIDNDVNGTDYTIGFFSALNTVLEAIDRLRDTSDSHHRISIVEIMGRNCGDLTVSSGLAGGAEICIVPERGFSEQETIQQLQTQISQGKENGIVVITEKVTDVNRLAKNVEAATGLETRVTILGHIQRGGAPTAFDRLLASRMGSYAVDLLAQGYGGRCIGIQNDRLVHHDIVDATEKMNKQFNQQLFDLCMRLA